MSFVEFNDVRKTYLMGDTEIHAANGVSFNIEKGEFCIIVGPSGAGKTTILNILGGMETLTSGEVIFDGTDISTFSERDLTTYRRDKIGFVFQFYNLVQNLTALENVELAGEITADPLDPRKVLDLVGLSHRIDNFPGQLSGGEQQRVAIARAIAKNPELLLADEPTGALDYQTGKNVLELLQNVCQKFNKTVVVITHNRSYIPIADRVIELNSGVVTEMYTNENPISAQEVE